MPDRVIELQLNPHPTAEVLRSIVEQVGDGLVAVDMEGQFIVWNPAATTILGRGPVVCEPEHWPQVYGLHCPDRETLLEVDELPLRTALLYQREAYREMLIRTETSPEARWISVRARPIYDVAGAQCGALALLVDVTSNHLDALSSQMMEGLFESTQDAIINIDPEGNILSWNPGAGAMFGYSAEEALGQPIGILAPTHLLGELAHLIVRLNQGRAISRSYTFAMKKGGDLVEVARSVTPIRNSVGRLLGCSTILTDVTKWRQAERELMASQEQLRQLSARLQTAQEQELHRISRELHDELGQLLTGLKLDLAWLDEKLSQTQPELLPRMGEMNQLLDQTMQSVRRLATQMRPQLLEALGLSKLDAECYRRELDGLRQTLSTILLGA